MPTGASCVAVVLAAASSAQRTSARSRGPMMLSAKPSTPGNFRIAVVGDVHDQWDEGDAEALRGLRPGVDLVLFVGDFGDEDAVAARRVANSDLPGTVVSIFGNHDAWFSLDKRKRRPRRAARPRGGGTVLEEQRRLLGCSNLEYARKDLSHLDVSVVGGRPYSIGGPVWPTFYVDEYGITSWRESGDRLGRIAAGAEAECLIFLAHNGPAGLGKRPGDMCGRDWPHRTGPHKGATGGDWGDRDLREAVRMAQDAGKRVCLVAFGHMHRRLIGGGLRKMVVRERTTGTVYLNAAQVPRWRGPGVATLAYDAAADEADSGRVLSEAERAAAGEGTFDEKQHWFAIVDVVNLEVATVRGCWLDRAGRVCEEEVWYSSQTEPTADAGRRGPAAA